MSDRRPPPSQCPSSWNDIGRRVGTSLLSRWAMFLRRGQDSNLQFSGHEPDELTIPLPRFFPVSFSFSYYFDRGDCPHWTPKQSRKGSVHETRSIHEGVAFLHPLLTAFFSYDLSSWIKTALLNEALLLCTIPPAAKTFSLAVKTLLSISKDSIQPRVSLWLPCATSLIENPPFWKKTFGSS